MRDTGLLLERYMNIWMFKRYKKLYLFLYNFYLLIIGYIVLERMINIETLKVSSKSNPNSVAGALANVFREKGSVEVQAVGAGALNQAIKAIAIARGFVAPTGTNLVCIPAFSDISIDGENRTAIKLIVEAK